MNLQFPISAQVAEPWPGLCLVAPKNETVPEGDSSEEESIPLQEKS